MKTVDELLSQLGDFGRFQRYLFLALAFPSASMSIAIYSVVFLEFRPEFNCNIPEHCNLTDPAGKDQCSLTCMVGQNSTESEECTSFTFSKDTIDNTLVTDFNAVCSQSFYKTVSSTTYMAGMLVGSFFFGWLSDSQGRHFCFTITVLFLTLGSIFAAFPVNYAHYIVARFVASMGGVGIFLTSFVLLLEYVGPSYR